MRSAAGTPILPGATIGILGGGQLGRMLGMAARTMGYDVHVLDPDPLCPAAAVASRLVTAGFGDADAIVSLAAQTDVVTLEIEQIDSDALARAAGSTPVRPGASVVATIQDRTRQKSWLDAQGFPTAPFRVATSATEVASAVRALGAVIVKAARGGYDGRGQARAAHVDDAPAAWDAVGRRACVVEQVVDFARELSVLVARRPDGEMRTFPPALNHHERGALDWSALPASVDAPVVARAGALAEAVAEALGVVGVLAVEMFEDRRGALLVNELAPRPHNTFHATERACATSQFEQLVRAICALPLGSVGVERPAAIANLFGDLWLPAAPDFPAALAVPGVRLHLYGKREARPGRKMGHLSAVAASADEARARVLEARRTLQRA